MFLSPWGYEKARFFWAFSLPKNDFVHLFVQFGPCAVKQCQQRQGRQAGELSVLWQLSPCFGITCLHFFPVAIFLLRPEPLPGFGQRSLNLLRCGAPSDRPDGSNHADQHQYDDTLHNGIHRLLRASVNGLKTGNELQHPAARAERRMRPLINREHSSAGERRNGRRRPFVDVAPAMVALARSSHSVERLERRRRDNRPVATRPSVARLEGSGTAVMVTCKSLATVPVSPSIQAYE